jgi:hypothetical protein
MTLQNVRQSFFKALKLAYAFKENYFFQMDHYIFPKIKTCGDILQWSYLTDRSKG